MEYKIKDNTQFEERKKEVQYFILDKQEELKEKNFSKDGKKQDSLVYLYNLFNEMEKNIDETTIGYIGFYVYKKLNELRYFYDLGGQTAGAQHLYDTAKIYRGIDQYFMKDWIVIEDLNCFETKSPYDIEAQNEFIKKQNLKYGTNIPFVGEVEKAKKRFDATTGTLEMTESEKARIWIDYVEKSRDAGYFANGVSSQILLSQVKQYVSKKQIAESIQETINFETQKNLNYEMVKNEILSRLEKQLQTDLASTDTNYSTYLKNEIDNIDDVTMGHVGHEINAVISQLQYAFDKGYNKLGSHHLYDVCKLHGIGMPKGGPSSWFTVEDLSCFEHRSPYDQVAINEFIKNQNVKYGTQIPLVGELEASEKKYFEIVGYNFDGTDVEKAQSYVELYEKRRNAGLLANSTNHYGYPILSLDERYIASKQTINQQSKSY